MLTLAIWLLAIVSLPGQDSPPPVPPARQTPPPVDSGGSPPPATTKPAAKEGSGTPQGPLPAELQVHVAFVDALTPTTSKLQLEDAVKALLQSRDPRVLPTLEKVLARSETEFRNARKMITMGVLMAFPKQAADFFFGLLEKGNPTQKESATYALGYLEDPRTIATIKTNLYSENKRVRSAAVYALVMRMKNGTTLAQNRTLATSGEEFPQAELYERHLAVARQTLLEVATSDKPLPEETFELLRKYSDSAMAAKLMEHYLKNLGEKEQDLGAVMSQMFVANRHWLGRPPAPAIEELAYTLSMQNLMSDNKPAKDIPLRASASDLETIRGSGSYLERGTQMDMAIDVVMTAPEICRPKLLSKDDKQAKIRYQVANRTGIRVGIGILGLRYWEGRLPEASYAEAEIDLERGVPTREVIFDGNGQAIGEYKFAKYEKLSDGSYVPLSIVANFSHATIGSRQARMHYVLSYKVHPGGVWMFSDATATETTDEGEELRAVSQAIDVTIVPKAEAPE